MSPLRTGATVNNDNDNDNDNDNGENLIPC
jgi:hypothetical protein